MTERDKERDNGLKISHLGDKTSFRGTELTLLGILKKKKKKKKKKLNSESETNKRSHGLCKTNN